MAAYLDHFLIRCIATGLHHHYIITQDNNGKRSCVLRQGVGTPLRGEQFSYCGGKKPSGFLFNDKMHINLLI